jgi:hypothetical protein
MTKISPANLAKAALYVRDFGAQKGTENAKKYCGIALLKSQGYFETDVSTSTTKKLLHDESISEKIVEASLWGAGKGDELTWGVLWNACAFETKKKRKDLKPGSDEFKEAVGELLSDVIYETQVVDSPLAKSDLMRSQDTGAKMVTMFASEMTVAYNMLYESVYNTNLDMKRYGKKEGFAKNFKNLFMTATAYTLTSAVTSILNTAVQAFRDRKDEEEKDLDYYVKNTVKNFITDSLIIGKIPYVKEAVSLYQGFSSTNPLTLWLESAFNAVEFWKKSQKPAKLDRYKKPETIAKYQAKHEESVAKNQLRAFEELLKSISYVSGFAVYNQYRDLMSAIDLYQDFTEPDMEEDE